MTEASIIDGETSRDAFLGGRLVIEQPKGRPHRAGLDAVFLGATIGDEETGPILDLGAGVGVAGLVAAARAPNAPVILVERDPVLAALADRNIAANFTDRDPAASLTVAIADIAAPMVVRERAGLSAAMAGHVLINPPFHQSGSVRPSPDAHRREAHVLGDGGLAPWIKCAATHLETGGTLTMIFRADGLADLLRATERTFGGTRILPLHPRPGRPASRVLLRATKGSRAPLVLLPGMVLHGETGNGFTTEVETVLRHGGGVRL